MKMENKYEKFKKDTYLPMITSYKSKAEKAKMISINKSSRNKYQINSESTLESSKKINLKLKTPKDLNILINTISRDFGLTQGSTEELLRISKKNQTMMSNYLAKEKSHKKNLEKRENRLFHINNFDDSSFNFSNNNSKFLDDSSYIFNTTTDKKFETENKIDYVNKVLDEIKDISTNLMEINKKLSNLESIRIKKKKIIPNVPPFESQLRPLRNHGHPIFIKTKFSKKTIEAFRNYAGHNFGGKSVRNFCIV